MESHISAMTINWNILALKFNICTRETLFILQMDVELASTLDGGRTL